MANEKVPNIEIIFKQKATSILNRSERGTAFLIVKNVTDDYAAGTYERFTNLTQVDEQAYLPEIYTAIKGALSYSPYELYVIRAEEENISSALNCILNISNTGWIAVAESVDKDNEMLVSWIKDKEKRGATYKAVVYKNKADNMHIVNFTTETVMLNDSEVAGSKYVPWILSMAASINIASSLTYKVCNDIDDASCLYDEELETAVKNGELVITKVDGELVIASGVNSLTTYDNNTKTEDMSYIECVETIDIVKDDVRAAFKDYIGNVRNTYANQMLFISAVRTYLDSLESDENYNVLDPDYDNTCDINVEKQRSLLAVNNPAAEKWSDEKVKHSPYKRDMFLYGNIKKCFCMQNLNFVIELAG